MSLRLFTASRRLSSVDLNRISNKLSSVYSIVSVIASFLVDLMCTL